MRKSERSLIRNPDFSQSSELPLFTKGLRFYPRLQNKTASTYTTATLTGKPISFKFKNSKSGKDIINLSEDTYTEVSSKDVQIIISGLNVGDRIAITYRSKNNNTLNIANTAPTGCTADAGNTPSANKSADPVTNYFYATETGATFTGFGNGFQLYSITIAPTKSITIASSGYSTFCSTSILDLATLPSGLKAYKVSEISSSSATLAEVTTAVTAGTGLILEGAASTEYKIATAASGTDISSTNKLQAATTAKTLTADEAYVLSNGEFHPANAGTLPAGKAYLLASDIPSGAAPMLSLDFGEGTTGIATTKAATTKTENVYYNLHGQRVAQPGKGLYIVNGKKVIIK